MKLQHPALMLSVLMSLFAAAATTAATEPLVPGAGEEQYFDELPVVVSVTRLPQTPLELPASLTVIDRRMIEASGVNDIPELLRLAAGFQIAHVSGTRYAVTYHGMGDDFARRIQVLVDGRSVYMPATSSVDWFDLPLAIEDIERIEVLRGPNGVAFGDNSFSGVVNIITQEAKSARGSYARVQAGQGNYRRVVARQGGKLGDLDLRLTLEHQSDDGFDDVAKDGGISSFKDDKLSNKLILRGDWRAGINDYVQINGGLNRGTRGFGYNPWTSNQANYFGEPAFDTENWRHYEQLKWRHIFSSDHELQLHFYHDYTDTRATFQTLPPLPVAEIQADTLSERYAFELEQRFRLSESIRMVWGGEARFDKVTAPGYLNSDEPLHNRMYRGFIHAEWKPANDYLVNIGAMLEHNDIAGTHLSPRLAVNYRYADNHAVRLSATQAYRTPSILEEHADYRAKLVGNEDYYAQIWKSAGGLDSEQITSYEIGWMGTITGPLNHYDVKLFREQIRNIISHPVWYDYPSPHLNRAIYFINHDWADLQGLEGQLKMTASDDTMLSFGYSYICASGTNTQDTLLLTQDTADSVSDNVPTHTFSWLAEHRFDSNWRGSLALYHVDHIDFQHRSSLNTADLRLARSFRRNGNEGVVSVVARDVGGAYHDYQTEMVVNPRVYLSVEYSF